MLNLIDRPKSVVTGKEGLEPLYTLRNFPVFFGTVDTPEEEDIRADMAWAIDRDTGIIQLTKLIPLDILYQSQHMDGTGKTWKEFYDAFSDYIVQRVGDADILEVGGGTGSLARSYLEKTEKGAWTVVEPNPIIEPNSRLHIFKGFVDQNFSYSKNIDAIVFSHTLEHAYAPKEFLQALAKPLEKSGKMIFAYPRLELWLAEKITTSLNFEHTMLLTEPFIDYLLPLCGFNILHKEYFRNHSIFYEVEKSNTQNRLPLPNHYEEYRALFLDFIEYHKELIAKLNTQIESFEGEVYLFGAHIFSQYLLEFGLNDKKISGILDNSPLKDGKRLYGTSLRVLRPETIKQKETVAVILKAGLYQGEIREQLEQINPRVRIYE